MGLTESTADGGWGVWRLTRWVGAPSRRCPEQARQRQCRVQASGSWGPAARCAISDQNQRSEGPEAAVLSAARPLGPVRSRVGLLGVVRGGSNLAPEPLGSVAGDPDRHRGWLLCPPLVPAAGGLAAGG
jgi:hypothetical protein